ncbi:glycosyl hydrolase family 95 catalytic domain-containing protein [Kutzneria chonburiensis]|uniref:Glycoside hydrolase family 95-like protein n=1 Tax=Kutzneria chonburiensis TaxID=1483604 RepID=A0ABV6MV28_9PSEU|nr:Tat pathway signal sequence domain protein [Kutzneria chonburiensis]
MVELSRRSVLAAGGALLATPALGIPDFDLDTNGLNWRNFIGGSDLVWQQLPKNWYDGPFLGNGFLGSGIYAEPGANAIRFNVQHSEVQDHRPEFGSLYGLARLPIGWFTLEPQGTITKVDWRLSLYDAELAGTITTTAGSIAIRAIVHNGLSTLAVQAKPTAGEAKFGWVFHPAPAVSPRTDPKFNKPAPAGYLPNPKPTTDTSGDATVITQPLLSGGEHVTAYQETQRGTTRTLYATVAWSNPDKTAGAKALNTLHQAVKPLDTLAKDHRVWWNAFYRKSFLSVPDGRLQSFYWIQLYKVASATRKTAPVMATTGPWLEPTPWPATWWNLNVQLEYWLINGSNHLELDSLTRAISQYRDRLSSQVVAPYNQDSAAIPRTTDITLLNGGTAGVPGQDPPTPETGNLTWALHNVWLTYRHTMDTDTLRTVVFPLLRKAINYYLHFLAKGDDGRLHLPKTFSPEYGVDTPDTNFDLALIRWGCQTLIEAGATLKISDPLLPKWQDVLANLTPYPTDANGFMIGAGQPFAMSHRHYSHMLSVYPLYLVNWEQSENRNLIQTSLNHWISFKGALQGYSYTGAASMAAQMLRGNDSAQYLSDLLRLYVQPNTLYKESGPVIETPLSAAQSMHDMICQSWHGVIRVFPAIPDAWADVTIDNFRTEGAFLISASRQHNVTRWVRVRSEAGAPCVVRHGIPGQIKVLDGHGRPLRTKELDATTIQIDLPRGGEAVLYRSGDRPDFTVAPVTPNGPSAPWGLPA